MKVNESLLYWDKEVPKTACCFCKFNIPEDGANTIEAYLNGKCSKSWTGPALYTVSAARDAFCEGKSFRKAKYRRFEKDLFTSTPRNMLEAIKKEKPQPHTIGSFFVECIWQNPRIPTTVVFITALIRLVTFL